MKAIARFNAGNAARFAAVAGTVVGAGILLSSCASRKPAPPVPPVVAQGQRLAEQAQKLSLQGRWPAAAAAWQKAVDQYRLLNDSVHEPVALHNLAHAQMELAQFDSARTNLESAAYLNQTGGRTNEWWRNQLALAQLDARQGRPDARKERWEQLLPRHEAQPIPDAQLRGLFWNELGLWRKESGAWDEALLAYQEAETAFRNAHWSPGLVAVAVNRAYWHLARQDFGAAAVDAERALGLAEAGADVPGIARALAAQGEAFVAAGTDLPRGIRQLRRAMENFRLLQMPLDQERAAQALEQALRAAGDVAGAEALQRSRAPTSNESPR
jgi:tetratricopeptide (TPR) repeat protein